MAGLCALVDAIVLEQTLIEEGEVYRLGSRFGRVASENGKTAVLIIPASTLIPDLGRLPCQESREAMALVPIFHLPSPSVARE